MERLRRVASLWSWLPAFRAVAETQHLPTASAQLRVSASALSRTIRLLEADLGASLFERQGRRIVLNEAGERLLVAVRDAMRRVHDGMSLMGSTALSGPVHLASANLVTDMVIVGLLTPLRADHPNLVPHVQQTDDETIIGELLQGRLDVALTTAPLTDANLARVSLGAVRSGVYCQPSHPAANPAISCDDHALQEHPFVMWGLRRDGSTCDGWPASIARAVGAVVHQPHMAVALAIQTPLLAVLPEVVARASVKAGSLVELASDVVTPVPVYAHHRHSLLPHGRAETVVEFARSAVASGL